MIMSNLLKATAIDHINMKVKNLEQSVKFYENLFGFKVKVDDNFPNKLKVPSKIIGNDSVNLCLYEVPDMSPEGGIGHFGFHIENFEQVLDKCKELGVEILYGGPVTFGESKSVYIKDADGYDIELSKIFGGGL